jgi:predicted P-loop ATPase
MAELAMQDEKVKMQVSKERHEQAKKDFGIGVESEPDEDWEKRLERKPKSTELKNTINNLILILENDKNLANLRYNCQAYQIYAENMPWKRPPKPEWRDADDAQLVAYIDRHYGGFSQRNYELALVKVTDDNSYHPIHEHNDNLPEWDKIRRVETVLIDYLGAEDTLYTRAVTRITLVGAIARIKEPGKKLDTILVLVGPQGIGKSTLLFKLARGKWHSDELSITQMKDKTAAENLQGNWIVEIAELAGLKKMDVETVKSFASRVNDKYRVPYSKRTASHPRQCIIVGTTNNMEGFLRDPTGGRRFLPVHVTGKGSRTVWDLTDADIDQIWAEALVLYEAGEAIYLKDEIAEEAVVKQREAMETDDREGLVAAYLDTLLPAEDEWNKMDISSRYEYINYPDSPTRKPGVRRRTQVCRLEIWCECFGNPKSSIKKSDSFEIEAILTKLGGWAKYQGNTTGKKNIPPYGVQHTFVR